MILNNLPRLAERHNPDTVLSPYRTPLLQNLFIFFCCFFLFFFLVIIHRKQTSDGSKSFLEDCKKSHRKGQLFVRSATTESLKIVCSTFKGVWVWRQILVLSQSVLCAVVYFGSRFVSPHKPISQCQRLEFHHKFTTTGALVVHLHLFVALAR